MDSKTKPSASGGVITYYPWGLIHKAGQKYTGAVVEKEKKDE